MSVTTVKQITTENGELYYLMAVRKENELDLTLTDCKQAFTGKLNLNEFDDGSEIKYLSLTVSALTEVNTSNSFLYQIETQGESILFKWKKVIAKNKVILEVGQVGMNKTDMEQTLRSMFSIIVNSLEESSIERNRLQLECERLSNERQKAIDSLRTCTQLKNELENEMYAKFVAVLNAKKEIYSEEDEEMKTVEKPLLQANINKMSETDIKTDYGKNKTNLREAKKKTEKVSSAQNNQFSDATISQSQGISSTYQELDSLLFDDDELRKPAAQKHKNRKAGRGKKDNGIAASRSSAPKRKIQTSLSDPDPEDLLNQM